MSAKRAGVALGIIGALGIGLAGNLQIVLEMAYANGLGSAEFWQRIDIKDLNEPLTPKQPRATKLAAGGGGVPRASSTNTTSAAPRTASSSQSPSSPHSASHSATCTRTSSPSHSPFSASPSPSSGTYATRTTPTFTPLKTRTHSCAASSTPSASRTSG